MGSDDIFKKEKAERIKRKIELREPNPARFLIVCEGEQTEPNYFNGIKRHFRNMDVDNVRIDVHGTGFNTISIVKETERLISEIEKHVTLKTNPYGNVWVVFDKDDFLPDQFNRAIFMAEQKGWRVAWSNECIELWFLLHFDFLQTAILRPEYITRLDNIFKTLGLAERYEKNITNIYDILRPYTSVAIRNGQAILSTYTCGDQHAQKNPASTVFLLINELESQSGLTL